MSRMQRVRAAWMLAAFAVTVPLACDTGGLVGGKCREGRLVCDGECLDPTTDPNNCGACGRVCSPGLICSASDCVNPGATGGTGATTGGGNGEGGRSTGGEGATGPEEGGAGPGAGGTNRGGAPQQGGRGGGVNGGTAGTAGSACLPPFDSAEFCGDCDTHCVAPNSLCAPTESGDSFECVPLCKPPLMACGDRCVDVNINPLHCGRCNHLCPSGICQGGECVGANTGHLGLYCLDYTWAQPETAHTVLLGNAVFLPLKAQVRVLAFTPWAPAAVRNQVDRVLAWSAAARGRQVRLDPLNEPNAQLSSLLNIQNYEVFLIYDQSDAPPGELGSLGASWATSGVLRSFAGAGGVIVVLDGAQGTGEMVDLVRQAQLASVDDHNPIALSDNKTRFYNRAPGDALGIGVVSPLSPVPYSCTFETSAAPSTDTVFVISDQPAPDVARPVVIHRTFEP